MARRWVLAVALLVACGGDDGTPQGPGGGYSGGPLALDQVCEVYRADVCAALVQCSDSAYRDEEHCRHDRECLGMADLVAEVDAGWLGYDAVAAGQCHASFAAAPCDFEGGFLTIPTVQRVLEACPGVLTPKQKPGAPCVGDQDCVADSHCRHAMDGFCGGSCEAYRKIGESCDPGNQLCDPDGDLWCKGSVCAPPSKDGDACAALPDCSVDLHFWCDDQAMECRAPVSLGAACAQFGQGPQCAEDLWCDAAPLAIGKCRAASEVGGACLQDRDCVESLTCISGDPLGKCSEPASSGGPCDASDDCADGSRCVTGACAPLAGFGEACDSGDPCAEGSTCESGACVHARFPGEPCGDAQSACVEGLCDGSACAYRKPLGTSCTDDDECASRKCQGGACIDGHVCFPG